MGVKGNIEWLFAAIFVILTSCADQGGRQSVGFVISSNYGEVLEIRVKSNVLEWIHFRGNTKATGQFPCEFDEYVYSRLVTSLGKEKGATSRWNLTFVDSGFGTNFATKIQSDEQAKDLASFLFGPDGLFGNNVAGLRTNGLYNRTSFVTELDSLSKSEYGIVAPFNRTLVNWPLIIVFLCLSTLLVIWLMASFRKRRMINR